MSEGNDICDAEHLLDIEPLERESQELGVIETKQKQIYYGSGRTWSGRSKTEPTTAKQSYFPDCVICELLIHLEDVKNFFEDLK